jgi:ferric-dicitrate binding protein FerR (iron transport regulator)
MKNTYLALLIKSFFENNVSKEVQQDFQSWFIGEDNQQEKNEVMLDVWENHAVIEDAQTREELKKIKKRIHQYDDSRRISFYKRFSRIAAILLLPLLSAALTYFFIAGAHQETIVVKEPELIEHFVPYGEQKHVILSDGSEVWINSGSLLIYEKEFSGKTRTLFLDGEANFSVACNPDKPFIVKTEYMDVEAVGTVFNVQSYTHAGKSITTLESGKVRIQTKNNSMQSVVILSPNEQLVYDRIADEFVTRKVEAAKNTQWIQGFLIFQGNTFEEIVNVIERKFQVSVRYDANKFKGRTFTVRFSPEENVNQVFDILKNIGEFNYRIDNNIVYIN